MTSIIEELAQARKDVRKALSMYNWVQKNNSISNAIQYTYTGIQIELINLINGSPITDVQKIHDEVDKLTQFVKQKEELRGNQP